LVDEVKANGFEMLGISSTHAEAAPNLPPQHRDPFGRMLVAQCQCDSLTLVTADRVLHAYDVDLVDARL
jgi:PIN domain nuclease of toxin-antitoxin system